MEDIATTSIFQEKKGTANTVCYAANTGFCLSFQRERRASVCGFVSGNFWRAQSPDADSNPYTSGVSKLI